MALRVKAGVRPHNLIIAAAAANFGESIGKDMIITSGIDGQHMEGSRHYTGEALDFRRSHLSPEECDLFVGDLRRRLDRDYDVVLESDHVHCEYDPKPKWRP